MKYILTILICLSFLKLFSQSNKIACERVKHHLSIIKSFLSDENSDSSLRRVESIAFLEKVSGIEGSGDGSDIGKTSITDMDYKKWLNWFYKYRKYLAYNKKINVIEIKGYK